MRLIVQIRASIGFLMEIDFFAETLFLILSYITVIRFVKIKLRRR